MHSPLHSLVTAIEQASANLNAKRTPSRHRGLEGWYPYYAGYTEQFAEGIIAAASGGRRLQVLDPWNGSGTTTRAAVALGHHAFGFDINPVATLVASAKLARPEDAAHVQGLAQRLATSSLESRVDAADPLLNWLGPVVVERYRAIESRIISELASDEHGVRLEPRENTLPPLAAFLLLALMRAARCLASIRSGSNPTWLRPAEQVVRVQGRKLEQTWLDKIAEMARDLAAHTSLLSGSGNGLVQIGNSSALPIEAESIDLVVTSPPYCTRIDYAMGAAFELAALGIQSGSMAHRALRADAMGTPLSRSRVSRGIPPEWPKSVKETLDRIKSHPSKASSTYYYKTYFQYFEDCLTSLSEVRRVLRKGGAAVLVVQSSYYKDVYVDLPHLYAECAKGLGLQASIGAATVVKKALAQINSNSRKHRSRKVYEESAVIIGH